MAQNKLFYPIADNVQITPTTSSQSVSLGIPAGEPSGETVYCLNDTGATVYIKFGKSDVTVTAPAGTPIASGGFGTFTIQSADTHAAVILATGSTTGAVNFQVGRGQ